MNIVIALVWAYLIGSLNFSILTSRFIKKEDVREKGSGNAGFTNSLRIYGKGFAVAVFLLDILKTFAAILPTMYFWREAPMTWYAAGLGVILGHNFPLYFGFKGGKGVLTSISAMVIIAPIPSIICVPIAVGIMFITGYVSLGSLFLLLYFPCSMMILHWGNLPLILFAWIVCLLGWWMHRGNIARLLNGTESRFGKHRKKSE